jgi:hypothetical protein
MKSPQPNPLTQQIKPIMQTFSFMWSDKLGAAIKAASIEPYPIEAHQGTETFRALVSAINQGIDSHLEAIQFTQDMGAYGRLKIVIEPQTLHVLVRRLMESGNEEAESLASGICETLDIELI